MVDEQRVQHGYLVVADISGYTAFLTGTELEHAQAIIHELTTLIRDRLAPPMRFVKLEGDAVLCYARDAGFAEGERLLQLLEACYFEFSNRLLGMEQATTCRCAACASIGSLDLKFVAHHGEFIVQREGDREDVAGPDVILLHRLLKNTVSERLGHRAYVLFTEACLSRMAMPAAFGVPQHSEEYESFGEVRGGVHDLEPVLREMRATRRLYVNAGEADQEFTLELPYPPALVWHCFNDPHKRIRWESPVRHRNEPDEEMPNARGRAGPGASSHCAHSAGVGSREIVDWRPFEYVTCRTTWTIGGTRIGAHPAVETIDFTPRADGGTTVVWRFRLADRRWFLRLPVQAVLLSRNGMARRWRERMLEVLAEDAAAAGVEAGRR